MKKRIGLIAHQIDKRDLIDWVKYNEHILRDHDLYATSEARNEIENRTGLNVNKKIRLNLNDVYSIDVKFKESSKGGDQELASMMISGGLDYLIYFWNPMSKDSHDEDTKAVLRQSVNYNIPIACNKNTADHIISSRLFDPSKPKGPKDLSSRIALVAHDGKKEELLEWVKKNKEYFNGKEMFATGTTGGIIEENTGLPVYRMKSGPDGGDIQISSLISNNILDYLFFFWDPNQAQPHDVDVKALLRTTVYYNVPTACNVNTADHIINSELFR